MLIDDRSDGLEYAGCGIRDAGCVASVGTAHPASRISHLASPISHLASRIPLPYDQQSIDVQSSQQLIPPIRPHHLEAVHVPGAPQPEMLAIIHRGHVAAGGRVVEVLFLPTRGED